MKEITEEKKGKLGEEVLAAEKPRPTKEGETGDGNGLLIIRPS